MDWKVKSLHNRMHRLDIQVQFFWNFLTTHLLLIPKNICFLQTVSLRRFWISLSANKSLEAEIAETIDYVSYLLAFEIVSWSWQLHFANQFVEWLILLEDFISRFWFGSFLGNRINWSFPGVYRNLNSLEFPHFPTKCETLHLQSMWQSTHFVCYRKSS